MSERFDELLSELPVEDPSQDLVARIQADIAIHREQKERIRNSLRTLNGIATIIGFLLLIPGFDQLVEFIPSITSLEIEQGLRRVLDSPNGASMDLWIAIESWIGNLLSNLEIVLILAFILLGFSALY